MPGAQIDRAVGGRGAGRTLPSGSGLTDFDGFPTRDQERAAEQQDTWDGFVLLTIIFSILWVAISVGYGLLWMVAQWQGWW